MSARDIVGGLAGAAIGAVKHPVGTAGEAISKARTAVGAGTAVGTAVAGTVVRRVRGDSAEGKEQAKEAAVTTAAAAKTATDVAADAAKKTATKATDAAQGAKKAAKSAPTKKTVESKAPAKKAARKSTKKAAPKREPEIVMAEPAPPLEPPIDVVGQALAAEAQEDTGFGRTTEPRGASRDEEHGEAALQRAEAAEIMEEIAEASDTGRVDVETPVGTTGADTGDNPDTAEATLQQPGTEPMVDPSLTKEIKSEQDTLHQASDPEKG